MKLVTIFLSLAACISICPVVLSSKGRSGWVLMEKESEEVEWERFKKHFHRMYRNDEEHDYRFAVFKESMARAHRRNAENVAGGGQHVFGVTRFSDETQEEFDRRYKGRKGHGVGVKPDHQVSKPTRLEVPAEVDWVKNLKTTSVNNQGQCGSCWAFSATQQVESAWMMSGEAPWRLSVQQAASCTKQMLGCGGGDTIAVYEQMLSDATKFGMKVTGLVSESMAPYSQSMYEECLSRVCTEHCTGQGIGNLTIAIPEERLTGYFVQISGYTYATPPCTDACANQDLDLLKANVAEYGPASVCVNAATWNDYVEGVVTSSACGGYGYGDLDHCVQMTGYDDTAEEPYFMVRNSWSTLFGDNGYIKLSSKGNTCGIADESTFVQVAKQDGF